jgi:enamine deaminase RidA (YjgF/YER057c/UK114 family)
MADISMLNPNGLARPASPYSHVARATKCQDLVFIAGQVAADGSGGTVGKGDFEAQCAQVFANLHAALRGVGADWRNVVQFTSYLTRAQDIAAFRAFRARQFPTMFLGDAYPPNTLLIISRLADESYLLEVQAIAAL